MADLSMRATTMTATRTTIPIVAAIIQRDAPAVLGRLVLGHELCL